MVKPDDLLIAVAYFSIPLQIVASLVKYPHLAMMPISLLILAVLFALFILCCGVGHLLRCLGYVSTDSLFVAVNWLTAAVSVTTSLYLLPLIPYVMKSFSETLQRSEDSKRKLLVFMAFLCHEIRNPLFAITSALSFLEDEEHNAESTKAIRSVNQSVELMLRLVNDVLHISRLESGKLEIEYAPFNLRHVLGNVVANARSQLHEKSKKQNLELDAPEQASDVLDKASKNLGVEFDYYVSPDVPTVVIGDSARVLQIFYNIVGNAVKFTDEGSIRMSVDVCQASSKLPGGYAVFGRSKSSSKLLALESETYPETAPESVDPSSLSLLQFAEEGLAHGMGPTRQSHGGEMVTLCIQITDTGPGIEKERLGNIFEPFSQSKLSDYRKHGGTGLGLSIVAKLLNVMGGSITVKSELGVGSKFTVYLPVEIVPVSTDDDNTLGSGSIASAGNAPLDPQISNENLVTAVSGVVSVPSDGLSRAASDGGSLSPKIGGEKPKGSAKYEKFDLPHNLAVVLVVDDNALNRKLIGRMLTCFGLEHIVATNGQEAVDAVLASRNVTKNPSDVHISMILMDISMPVMDGVEATRIIRRHGFDEPIITLTAATVEESRENAVEAGATEYATVS